MVTGNLAIDCVAHSAQPAAHQDQFAKANCPTAGLPRCLNRKMSKCAICQVLGGRCGGAKCSIAIRKLEMQLANCQLRITECFHHLIGQAKVTPMELRQKSKKPLSSIGRS